MSRTFSARMLLWLWLPILMLAASIGAAFGTVTLARAEGDRVQILGSGDNISILVTTGRSEVLIATGTDRTAFGNAYDTASIAPGSRPDILLIAGSGQSLNVPTSAVDWFADTSAYALHPLRAETTAGTGLERLGTLPRNPIRFTLDNRIVVVIESLPTEADGTAFAWRVVISRENSRIAVVSAAEHADRFAWADPVSIVILAADANEARDLPIDAAAIIGPAVSLEPPDDSSDVAISNNYPARIVPVRPGGVATLTFVRSGVELTSDDRIYSIDQSG